MHTVITVFLFCLGCRLCGCFINFAVLIGADMLLVSRHRSTAVLPSTFCSHCRVTLSLPNCYFNKDNFYVKWLVIQKTVP